MNSFVRNIYLYDCIIRYYVTDLFRESVPATVQRPLSAYARLQLPNRLDTILDCEQTVISMRRSFSTGCVVTPTHVNYAQPSLSPSTLLRELSEEMGQINVPPLLSPCCVNADSQQPDKMFHENEEAPNYAPKLYKNTWYEDSLDLVIHTNLRESELKFPSINMDSPELSQRPFLVNFINHLSDCLQLANSTRYLAVRLLDGFMDKHSIMTYRLKLVSLSCLHIASKLEPCFHNGLLYYSIRS